MATMTISGKVSDLFGFTVNDDGDIVIDYDGYVPYDIGVGGGDYVEFEVDIATGQILNWPTDLTIEKIAEAIS